MTRSTRLLFMAAAGLALGALLALGLYRHRLASAPAPTLETGTYLPQPRPINAFRLVDQNGQAFTRERLQDHWSIVFFGFTSCPDICPARLATLAALARKLRGAGHGREPQIVFVSIDPSRDTPEAIGRYVGAFDPAFVGLTAPDPLDLQSLTQDFGAAYSAHRKSDGSFAVEHTGALFIATPRAQLRAVLTGPFAIDALQRDVERVLAAGS